MPVLDGRDFSVFYTPEPTTFGLNDDDSTYTQLPECESVSGRGVQEDLLEPTRHGKRVRSAALYGKIDHEDLSLTCNLTDDAVAGDVYSTFLKSIFDDLLSELKPIEFKDMKSAPRSYFIFFLNL